MGFLDSPASTSASSGARALGPASDVMVLVDVLSFSTGVEVAVSRGAVVYPVPLDDARVSALAREKNAIVAAGRRDATPESPYSLSPASLTTVPPGTRLVLPSPNGGDIWGEASDLGVPLIAGCLRNATAVARACRGKVVTAIAAGERWPDGSIRPPFEDLVGAGAVLAPLGGGSLSPEAQAAVAAFHAADLKASLRDCSSGRELIAAGFEEDVRIAVDLDVSGAVPVLAEGAFVDGRRFRYRA